MSDDKLVAHARKLRADLNNELPNGVGNTIDALCDALQSERASMEGEIVDAVIAAVMSHARASGPMAVSLHLDAAKAAVRAILTSSKTGDETK